MEVFASKIILPLIEFQKIYKKSENGWLG